jgi:hypothetical protein
MFGEYPAEQVLHVPLEKSSAHWFVALQNPLSRLNP